VRFAQPVRPAQLATCPIRRRHSSSRCAMNLVSGCWAVSAAKRLRAGTLTASGDIGAVEMLADGFARSVDRCGRADEVAVAALESRQQLGSAVGERRRSVVAVTELGASRHLLRDCRDQRRIAAQFPVGAAQRAFDPPTRSNATRKENALEECEHRAGQCAERANAPEALFAHASCANAQGLAG